MNDLAKKGGNTYIVLSHSFPSFEVKKYFSPSRHLCITSSSYRSIFSYTLLIEWEYLLVEQIFTYFSILDRSSDKKSAPSDFLLNLINAFDSFIINENSSIYFIFLRIYS